NPPFFQNFEEQKQSYHDREPHSICTGTENEMITPGGEIEFVKILIRESLQLNDRIQIFSSMVGKKSSLKYLIEEIKYNKIPYFTVTEFSQGQTSRWGIAWSFHVSLENVNF